MNYKNILKTAAYTTGKLLGVAGIIFVLYRLSLEYTLDSFTIKFNEVLYLIAPLIAVNQLSTMIGIYMWHSILRFYAKENFSYKESYYYFSKTEIAKYLPGNVFHFMGRQLLAKKIGISQAQMIKISGTHIILLVVSTFLSSTLFLLFSNNIDRLYKLTLIVATATLIIGTSFAFSFLNTLFKLKMDLLLTISLGIQGLMLGVIVWAQMESITAILFFEITGIYILSWLVGFVTPGASGGIGVREGAFIALAGYLHIPIESEIVLFSILFMRLINIATDIFAYGTTFLLRDVQES